MSLTKALGVELSATSEFAEEVGQFVGGRSEPGRGGDRSPRPRGWTVSVGDSGVTGSAVIHAGVQL